MELENIATATPCPLKRATVLDYGFTKLVQDLLKTMLKDFPDDAALKDAVENLPYSDVSAYKGFFARFYANCYAKNSNVFKKRSELNQEIVLQELDLSLFEQINFATLYRSMQEETQKKVWKHIVSIANLAHSLVMFSDQFCDKIDAMAMNSLEKTRVEKGNDVGEEENNELNIGAVMMDMQTEISNNEEMIEEIAQVYQKQANQ